MRIRILVLAVMALAPTAAQAGPRDDVIDTLVKCADLSDKMARADCFDAATPQLRAVAPPQTGLEQPLPATAPPPIASAPSAAAAFPTPPAEAEAAPSSDTSWMSTLNPFSGGAPDKPAPDQMAFQAFGREILPVTIGVTEYHVFRDGSFSVTLDNGQIWREHDRDYDTPPFSTEEKNVVTIDRGMLGGFNLVLKGKPKIYKVVRAK
jgi:hypothetical protein